VTTLAGPSRLSVGGGWFVLWDEFRRDRYTGPLAATLDRWTGDAWIRDDTRPLITPGRVLTYPGLGRRRPPQATDATLYRVRVQAPGLRPLYPPDRDDYATGYEASVDSREFVVPHYDHQNPPSGGHPNEPELLRLAPAPGFAYPPVTRVISGRVRRPGGGPGIGNVLVQSASPDVTLYGDWYERAVTDAGGEFRLPLRWRGRNTEPDRLRPRFEVFTVEAHESPNRSGSAEVSLDRRAGEPGGPEPVHHVIEIGS
jgi:hypothetical protein